MPLNWFVWNSLFLFWWCPLPVCVLMMHLQRMIYNQVENKIKSASFRWHLSGWGCALPRRTKLYKHRLIYDKTMDKKWCSPPIFIRVRKWNEALGRLLKAQMCQWGEPGKRRMMQIPDVWYEDEDFLLRLHHVLWEGYHTGQHCLKKKKKDSPPLSLSLCSVVQLSDVVIRFSVLN